MNVVTHATDNYAPVTATSIVSLFENNKEMDEINFYVIEHGYTNETKEKYGEIAKKYNRNIYFIHMPDINEEQHLGLKKIKENWLFDSYVRMFLDVYLPETVDRVLYLDGDTLVLDDLTDLWNMDLNGAPAAISVNCQSKQYYDLFKMSYTSIYCNSGVILFDLTEWRRRDNDQKVRDILKENDGYVFFMEQSVLSMVLQDEAALLPARYNALTEITNLSYEEIMTLRKPLWYYSKEEIDAAREHPAIIHMTNSFLITNRGYSEYTNHPAKDLFRKYYALTPWRDEPLSPDNRSTKKKVVQNIIDHTPNKVLLPIVSFVYNHVRIWNIKKDMRKYSKIH